MNNFKQHQDGGRVIPHARKFYFGKMGDGYLNQAPQKDTKPADIKKQMMGFPDKRMAIENGLMNEEEYLFLSQIYKSIKSPTFRGLNVSKLIKKDKYLLPAYALFVQTFTESLNHALENRESFGHNKDFLENWAAHYRDKHNELRNITQTTEKLLQILEEWEKTQPEYDFDRYGIYEFAYLVEKIPSITKFWLDKADFILEKETLHDYLYELSDNNQVKPVDETENISVENVLKEWEKLTKTGSAKNYAAQYMKKMLEQMRYEQPENHLDNFSEFNFVNKNHTFESMQEEFGIGAIQWGSSISKNHKEQQALLNRTVQTFSEIAMLLDIPRHAIGLGHQWGLEYGLGLAFASQGKSGAKAFYHSKEHFLHLNRKKSEGSTVHEWFHGLDHALGHGFIHYLKDNGRENLITKTDISTVMFTKFFEQAQYIPEIANAMREYSPHIMSCLETVFNAKGLINTVSQDNIGDYLKENESRILMVQTELKNHAAHIVGETLSGYIPHLKNLDFWQTHCNHALKTGQSLSISEYNLNLLKNSVCALFSDQHPLRDLLDKHHQEQKKEYGVVKTYCFFDNIHEHLSVVNQAALELKEQLDVLKSGQLNDLREQALNKIDNMIKQAKEEWLPNCLQSCVNKRFTNNKDIKEWELMLYAREHFQKFYCTKNNHLNTDTTLESKIEFGIEKKFLYSRNSQIIEILFPQLLENMCSQGYQVNLQIHEHPVVSRSKLLDKQMNAKAYFGTNVEVFARLGEALIFHAGKNQNLFSHNMENSPQYLKSYECGDLMERFKLGLQHHLKAGFDLNPNEFKRKPDKNIPKDDISVKNPIISNTQMNLF